MPLPGWLYNRSITDSTGGSLSGAVCKIALTSANFDFSLANSDGSDLRVYDETAAAILPIWLMDYDSVGQTATLFYKSTLTSHTHNLYYGNSAASAVSSFSSTFDHGTGFDSSWGDLTANLSGSGRATRYAKAGGLSDARQLALFRRSQTPDIASTVGSGLAGASFTALREFSIVSDPYGNIAPDGSGNWIGYLGIQNALAASPPAAYIYRFVSTDQGKTWGSPTLVLSPGSSGTYDDFGVRPGTAIKFGPTDYRMWYTANSTVGTLAGVGLATSTDNVTWTRAGSAVSTGSSGLISGVGLSGVPSVKRLQSGSYVMFCEARGATVNNNVWQNFGWTSSDASNGSWSVMNGGSPVIPATPSSPWMGGGDANPHFLEITPGSLYAIWQNGSPAGSNGGTLSSIAWQLGFLTNTSPTATPWTNLADNPAFGHNTTSSFGVETSGWLRDPTGTSYVYHIQDYTAPSGDNSVSNIYRAYPVLGQSGLIDTSAVADAAIVGVAVSSSGTLTAEAHAGLSAHKSSDSAPYIIGLIDSASLPNPDTAANIAPLLRVAIGRCTFQASSAGTPGDIIFNYWDSTNTKQYWNGSTWSSSVASATSTDCSREVLATIQDDGTNYRLTVVYADTMAFLVSVLILKTSVHSFSSGRVLISGDPFTDTAAGGQYFRRISSRPYVAIEPALTLGSRQSAFTPDPTATYLLFESGDHVLFESGDSAVLLEHIPFSPNPGSAYLIIESGDHVLLESGSSAVLLEKSGLTPPPPFTPDASASYLLFESGDHILLETGTSAFLVEVDTGSPAHLLTENRFHILLESGLGLVALEATAPSGIYIGRFRLGDVVPILFQLPSMPDAYPTAGIVPTSISASPYSEDGLNFLWPLLLDSRFTLGTFTVTCSYVIGGTLGRAQVSFDVVDGGDVGSRVISLFSYERPESMYVLAQLEAGSLVQGNNPHL